MGTPSQRLNRRPRNAVSSKRASPQTTGRPEAACGCPAMAPSRDQPRPALGFCGFSDCTLKKLWSPIVATW